jgi:hypothetical protein
MWFVEEKKKNFLNKKNLLIFKQNETITQELLDNVCEKLVEKACKGK